jgi:hypothetical protein
MNKKNMTGNAVKKQIKDRVSEGVDTIKKDTKATKRLIKNKVTAGVEIAKDETGEVMGKVKMAASEANRKRKAAVRSMKS